MPASQAALRTSALVMRMAFPHHAAQETIARDVWRNCQTGAMRSENEERRGGE
jgi:hypothetical protein